MVEEEIRVEGPPEVLEGLRRELLADAGDGIEVQPLSRGVPGELREPILTGLLISFTSMTAVAIRTAGSIIERWMTHQERKELLRIYREKDDVEISLSELLRNSDPDA